MPQVKVPFEVTGWEPEPLELGEPGAVTFGRVTLRKTFTGPLTGTSVVAMTSAAVGEAPVGYVAVELVTGTLDGRSGTFVYDLTTDRFMRPWISTPRTTDRFVGAPDLHPTNHRPARGGPGPERRFSYPQSGVSL